MMESTDTPIPAARSAFAALRRFNRPPSVEERCDLCSAPLMAQHQHLLEPIRRSVQCACDACSVLFTTSPGTRYRRIPRRIEFWSDFQMTDLQWAGLGVPIALAFFFHSTPLNQIVAMYPSPAGPTEAALPSEAWQGLADENPMLDELEPDVETLLVNRVHGAREYYRAPIDECFKLVGLIKSHWRGLSGGKDAWDRITNFFVEFKRRSTDTGRKAGTDA
jgi:hypothetical protein